MRGQLRGDLFGERAVEPAILIDERQLFELELGIGREMLFLQFDVGPFGVLLRADRHIFARRRTRSEEHTSELQSLMRISYAVFCLKKKTRRHNVKHKQTKPQLQSRPIKNK